MFDAETIVGVWLADDDQVGVARLQQQAVMRAALEQARFGADDP